MKKFKIISFGCKVNYYETEALSQQLLKYGWEQSLNPDLVIINSCTVTQRADSKVIKAVRKYRRQAPSAKIALIGCSVEKAEDRERFQKENIDFLLPQSRKHTLLECLGLPVSGRGVWDLNVEDFSLNRAFVKIQDGCSNACSFCKVRIVRGKSVSRPEKDILEEIKRLTDKGFKEIVLCGVNIIDYKSRSGSKGRGLLELLERVVKIPGNFRLRLSSLEITSLEAIKELLDFSFTEAKICRHFHFPFQSGDDTVLRAMNKKGRLDDYWKVVSYIRQKSPLAGISCDIIAGFPGESRRQFLNTINLVREIIPVRVHIFPFSPRKGTPAFAFKDKVPPAEVKRRVCLLRKEADCAVESFYQRFIGRQAEVVFDGKINKGYVYGYSREYLRVRVKNPVQKPGRGLYKVKIKKISGNIAQAALTAAKNASAFLDT